MNNNQASLMADIEQHTYRIFSRSRDEIGGHYDRRDG